MDKYLKNKIEFYHTDIAINLQYNILIKYLQQYNKVSKLYEESIFQNNDSIIKKIFLDNNFLGMTTTIQQMLLSTKNYHTFEYKILNYNSKIYNDCINYMIQFGLLYKLFYFNIIDVHYYKFGQLFDKFVDIFIDGKYHCCWQRGHYFFYNNYSFNFMYQYLNYYRSHFNDNDRLCIFQQKLNNLIQNIQFKNGISLNEFLPQFMKL